MHRIRFCNWLLATHILVAVAGGAEWGLKGGPLQLASAGPLAFGPDSILIVGDVQGQAVYAIDTQDAKGDPQEVDLRIDDLTARIASVVQVPAAAVAVNDLAVNPASGCVYLSVTLRQDAQESPAIIRIDPAGEMSAMDFGHAHFAKVQLPQAGQTGRRNPAITDLAYTDGKVLLSGSVANPAGDRPKSMVREIPFPFTTADSGVQIEIFHGAHGRLEDYAAVRTFVPFVIDGEPSLLAGFTCTPLVRFDLDSVASGGKVRGTTVAELGNRNTPYDIIVYEKNGEKFLLMANDRRGVMKISAANIGRKEGITTRVGGSGLAGQEYETIDALTGTVQLDRLNDEYAIVVINSADRLDLRTVALP